jgi:hypothetical protein
MALADKSKQGREAAGVSLDIFDFRSFDFAQDKLWIEDD